MSFRMTDYVARIIQMIYTYFELYMHTGFTFQEPIWLIQCFTETTISSTITMYLPLLITSLADIQ